MDKNSIVQLASGAKMPIIGLGTWKLQDTGQTIATALELGYTLIDTSGNYGTQPGISEGLKMANRERDNFFLTTKVENDEDPIASLTRSVRELDLEFADLTLIHWPPPDGAGEDLWQGLIKAKEQGLTKDIGVSNYSAKQIETIARATGVWPAVDQIEWTPFGHKMELLDFAKEHQIVLQAWSPLTRAKQLQHDRLDALATTYHKTPAQIVLRWDVQLGVVPLPKAHSHDHLQQNLDIFDFALSGEDMETLSNLNSSFSSLGTLHY